MSIKENAFLGLVLVSLLWGTAGVVAKLLMQELHPFVILFYRFSIASLFVLPWFIKEKQPKDTWKILIPFSLLGFGNAFLYYSGLSLTTVTSASVISACTPLFTALFSHLLISERTSKEKVFGIIIGLIGVLTIIVLPLLNQGKSIGGNITGNIYLVLSVLCWTFYLVGSRKFLSSERYSPLVMSQYNFITLAVTSLIFALITNQSFFTPAFYTPSYFFLFLFATIPLTVVPFWTFQWVMKHLSATTSSLKSYLQLIIGVFLSITFLDEQINLYFIIGTFIVLIGITIASGKSIGSKILSRFSMV